MYDVYKNNNTIDAIQFELLCVYTNLVLFIQLTVYSKWQITQCCVENNTNLNRVTCSHLVYTYYTFIQYAISDGVVGRLYVLD